MKRHVGVLNKHNGIYAKNIHNTTSNGFCLPGHDSRRILVIFNLNWTRRIYLILGLCCVPINFLYSDGVMSCQCKLENNIYPKLDCRKLYTHPLNFICRIIRKGYVTNVSPEQFAPFIQNLFVLWWPQFANSVLALFYLLERIHLSAKSLSRFSIMMVLCAQVYQRWNRTTTYSAKEEPFKANWYDSRGPKEPPVTMGKQKDETDKEKQDLSGGDITTWWDDIKTLCGVVRWMSEEDNSVGRGDWRA